MKKGFTLIELLVIITIITIMSALVIPNLKFGEEQFAVQNSAHKLVQDLRKVQQMAMSSSEFNGTIPDGGYGIYFKINENSYILFADCSGDKLYNEASEKILEQSFFNEKIIINDIFSGIQKSELNIVFAPPDPIIHIEPSDDSMVEIFITDQVSEKVITVNKAGLISIEGYTGAAPSDRLIGWDYRKSHDISGSTAGAQTDYQMKIKTHRTTGTVSYTHLTLPTTPYV